jgi:hypothetical protein
MHLGTTHQADPILRSRRTAIEANATRPARITGAWNDRTTKMQLIPAVFFDVAGTTKVPVVLVTPAVRKKRVELPSSEDNEDASRALAQRLCPSGDLSLKMHVGRDDAILKG